MKISRHYHVILHRWNWYLLQHNFKKLGYIVIINNVRFIAIRAHFVWGSILWIHSRGFVFLRKTTFFSFHIQIEQSANNVWLLLIICSNGEGWVFFGQKGGIFLWKKTLNSFIVAARVISQGSNSFKIFFSFENKIENWKRRVKTQVQIKKQTNNYFFSQKKRHRNFLFL